MTYKQVISIKWFFCGVLFSLFSVLLVTTDVLAEAAKEVMEQNTENPVIFVGKPMECSVSITRPKNCCSISDGNWLGGIILNCNEEERELAKAKDGGRAIYVGEYCHNKMLDVCTSYHKIYCVFDSKIARIVQNEGRKNQLGIGFGEVGSDESYPNCRGLTEKEISQLNFDAMDFSKLYSEIKFDYNEKMFDEKELKQGVFEYTSEESIEKSIKEKIKAALIKNILDKNKT